MKIFLPSLFKIGVITFIIAFFSALFFVGLLRGAYADWPGECSVVLAIYEGTERTLSDSYKWKRTTTINGLNSDGTFDITQNVYVYPGEKYQLQYRVRSLYYENGQWHVVQTFWSDTQPINHKGAYPVHNVVSLPVDCNDCDFKRNSLISSCDGESNVDWDTYDESTCTGKCKIPINANLGSPNQCQ